MSDNELASSADEGSDAEKAEELNAKVQRVMAPLMKKMAKRRERTRGSPSLGTTLQSRAIRRASLRSASRP